MVSSSRCFVNYDDLKRRNTALISKRISEVPSVQADAIKDFTDAYQVALLSIFATLLSQWSLLQSWVVHRKQAVMMSRMEYTLALDGDHIHVRITEECYGLLANFRSIDHAFYQGLYGQQQDHLVPC